jgi:hypothetical protein
MKWLGVLKFFAHPSLLPLAVSTFVSIAGPGGVAEISRHAPVVASVPTIDAPHVAAAPSEPLVLVLRPVSPQIPPDATSPEAPTAAILVTQAPDDGLPPVTETSPVPDSGGEPAILDAGPVAVDATAVPENPTPRSDVESAPPASQGPDDFNGDDTEVPGRDDSGGPDGGDEQDGDSSGDDSSGDDSSGDQQPVCDPPGNGPDPHDGVPPGHDQNDDGIDDRCQDGTDDDTLDVGSDNDGTGNTGDDPPDNGSAGGDGADNDDGADDDGPGDGDDAPGDGSDGSDAPRDDDGAENDDPACDPPGNGPVPHGNVPPGHDKNEDGIDDRCQEGGSETDGESDGGQKDKNKREDETRFTIALLRRI